MSFDFNLTTIDNNSFAWLNSDAYQPAPHCIDWCQEQVNNLFRYFDPNQQILLYVIGLILVIGFLLNTFSIYCNEEYQEKVMMVDFCIIYFAAMMNMVFFILILFLSLFSLVSFIVLFLFIKIVNPESINIITAKIAATNQ